MENKYYTPEIEEFHIGFEYEYRLNDEDWDKKTYQQDSFLSVFADGEYSFEEINEKSFRVKHLDREDIESLGWTQEQGKYFMKNQAETHRKSDENVFSLSITEYSFRFPNITIKYLIDGVRIKFEGTIRNKSELKRIMKQANIG